MTSYPSRPEPGAGRLALITCGALTAHVRDITARRGWPVEVHSLPAILHNRPARIAPAARSLALELRGRGLRVALAYADCGSYGALDGLCDELSIRRIAGLHCYDVFGGADRIRAMLEADPGTYLLTDFLIRSFRRSVLAELGLDRHPGLWPDYFGHYRRLAWLAQDRDPGLERAAAGIADLFGLPLTIIDTGTGGLERELELLVGAPVTSVGAAPGGAAPGGAAPGGQIPGGQIPGAAAPGGALT